MKLLRKKLSCPIMWASCLLRRLAEFVYLAPSELTIQETRVKKWVRDCGDKTLRLDYPLNASSIVFDVGGYEGQWTSDIFSKYCCTIHVFEPVRRFSQNIENRFLINSKIKVHKFGLAAINSVLQIEVDNDRSSLFCGNGEPETVEIKNVSDIIKAENIIRIDLMKINIEGAEYDLLENLIQTNMVKSINNIQVQFHDFVANAEERMIKIEEALSKTHTITYRYPFVWENWKAKEWDFKS